MDWAPKLGTYVRDKGIKVSSLVEMHKQNYCYDLLLLHFTELLSLKN